MHVIFNVLSYNFNGILGQTFYYLSLTTHFESLARGVIDTKDLLYFFSIVAMGIILSEMSLAKRNLTA